MQKLPEREGIGFTKDLTSILGKAIIKMQSKLVKKGENCEPGRNFTKESAGKKG